MEILEYIKEDGSNPYKKWFDTLNAQAAAKVTVAKARMELGNTSNIKWFEGIGEYRIDWGPGYRVYLNTRRYGVNRSTWWWHQKETAARYQNGKNAF